jgi:SAM-dependent methyltransferase
MELMMNIKWEDVNCHICKKNGISKDIKIENKPLVDGQFGYSVHPVICPNCGLVYLNPRWSKKDYDIFYSYYYDPLYRLEIKPDYGAEGVIRNMEIIYNRIKEYIPKDATNILDVGCGSGYGLKYMQEKINNIELYGIESSTECCDFLQSEKIGAKLVTTDFDDNWTKEYKNAMDIVILRHVVEHMLDPIDTLKKIRNVLKKEGIIYFATPDMMHPRIKLRDYDDWWQYWFRAVHPYYYCKETLFKTLEMAGLYPYRFGDKDNEEVWVLAKKNKTAPFKFESVYNKQKEVLSNLLP